jgi:type IV secretion system protein VirB4
VTLRKKRVFCVFATQEVSKAANSKLRTTIVSQCLTKIYLADPSAQSAIIAEYYRLFGLEDNEIAAHRDDRTGAEHLPAATKTNRNGTAHGLG